MASSAPRGNESWISKPSDTSFLPIGQRVQTTTNPIPGNINSCALTQPRASSPAPRANATSQVLTGSSLLTSTELVSSPPLYLSEPLFGSIPSTVLGGLVRSSNPPTPSDDMLYDSSTTQVLSYSTSLIPPMTRRSTPPAVLGASKLTVALTPSKASYTANLSLPCPFSLCVLRPFASSGLPCLHRGPPGSSSRPFMPNLPLSSLLSPEYSGSLYPSPFFYLPPQDRYVYG